MHILVDYSSPTLITSFVQRRQELICSYHLVCAYIKLEFKEEQITMMKICLKMMIPMVHFACWTGTGWGVDPRGPTKNPAWGIYSRGGSIDCKSTLDFTIEGGGSRIWTKCWNKLKREREGGLTSYHDMKTANITIHAQELKSVNAKESAALAQAFVSKEFLEVQVEKGNIEDVLTAISFEFF